MTKRGWVRPGTLAALLIGLLWTWLVNGSVPGYGTPTLGQAASMLGYAQAFADQHWYSLHAYAFGYPVPASLATGLPLASVTSWFLRAGLLPPDAYSASVACWLGVAYFGAWGMARTLGVRSWLAAFAAAAWTTMPMIWAHEGYSSLALGLALLPAYLRAGFALYPIAPIDGHTSRAAIAVAFFVACTIALFMDGYTFVMFAVASGALVAYHVVSPSSRRWAITYALPVSALGFVGAYLCYGAFMGRSSFDPASLDFFRGWGLDLAFLGKPSSGDLWFWDALGWTAERNESSFYGDASVWTTTFALPLGALGIACFISGVRKNPRVWLFVGIAAFGLYLALGPTLKWDVRKPAGFTGQGMPAQVSDVSTGNAFLSTRLPGFKSMRAAYRWEALFLLGMWGLVAMRAGRSGATRRWGWAGIYLLIIIAGAPHLLVAWGDYRAFHRDFGRIDKALGVPLAARLTPGSKVFIVPYGNDVMANYLAPRLHVTTYNIGGDKQVEIAHHAWPLSLRSFSMGKIDVNDVPAIRDALLADDVDAVVIPYFSTLYAAHVWPCLSEAEGYSSGTLALFEPRTDFRCPGQLRLAYAPVIEALRAEKSLALDEQPLFVVVRLLPRYRGEEGRKRLAREHIEAVNLPLDVRADPVGADLLLDRGWYPREVANRWSGANAHLQLPVPVGCRQTPCVARLTVTAFAASLRRPVSVRLSAHSEAAPVTSSGEVFTDDMAHVVSVLLPAGEHVVSLELAVPEARSPATLGISSDSRVLGVSLSRVEISPP
jgi:hypothetical protein